MNLHIFARFHARPDEDERVAAALHEVMGPTRAEPGCMALEVYRATRDHALFHLHSCWVDEAAFDAHIGLPHTVRFLAAVEPLVDHPLEITRVRPLAASAR